MAEINPAFNPAGRWMSAEETEQMAALVAQRRGLLAEILEITGRQEAAIEAGLVQELMATLNEKQTRVDQLRKIQDRLQPMAEVPAENRVWSDPAAREQCRAALRDSDRLQAEILSIDQRCEQAMLQRRDELFDSLGRTTGAATAARAYASGGGVAPSGRPATSGGSLDLASG